MWRDVRLLREQNKALDKENGALQEAIKTLRQENTERQGRIERLGLVDASVVAKALELAATAEGIYDAQIFRGELLRQGLTEQDAAFLVGRLPAAVAC